MDAISTIIEILKFNNRPFISKILYCISCTLLVLTIIINNGLVILDFNWLNKVKLMRQLSDNESIIKIAVIMGIIHIVFTCSKKCILHIFKDQPEEKLYNKYAIIYSIDDVIDLLSSIVICSFMVSVFIQIYKTGVFFSSIGAIFIYVIVVVETLKLIYMKFYGHSKNIINNVLEVDK